MAARCPTEAVRLAGTTCPVAPQHWIRGPDAAAEAIDLSPLMSGPRLEDEGLFLVQHKYWQEAMRRALAVEKNFEEQTDVDHA